MKIKKNNTRYSYNTIAIIIFLAVISLALFSYLSKNNNGKTKKDKKRDDIELTTHIDKRYDYHEIISTDLNKVYEDSIFRIHYIRKLGSPSLLYVYKGELSSRNKTDRFSVDVHLKDSKEHLEKTGKRVIKKTLKPDNPITINVNGIEYTVYEHVINSDFFELDNIRYIFFGRFKTLVKHRDQKINRIKFDLRNVQDNINVNSYLEEITIEINQRDFNKLSDKREEAIINKVLITGEDDLVNCNIYVNKDEKAKGEIRLKGDWVDHLVHDKKWSFRIITDGTKTIKGMRKFSIQHPKARHYLWEWLFNKVVKDNDIIGLRYDFVKVTINVKDKNNNINSIDMGIMALEESFDKILIENNKRREGLILAFDESIIWNERSRVQELNLDEKTKSRFLLSAGNAPIKLFNQNKVLSDPNLKKQFENANILISGLRSKTLNPADVFDFDKLTTFVALSNLFGGSHGLIAHNLRFYYNPITNKLEPISFDSNSGHQLSKILQYRWVSGNKAYDTMLRSKLERYSSTEFIQGIVDTYYNQINTLSNELNTEFTQLLDLSILEYNSNFIKKFINPTNVITSGLVEITDEKIVLDVKNISNHPIRIGNLEHIDGQKLSKFVSNEIVEPSEKKIVTIELKDAFLNAFVSKKNKIGSFRYPKDVKKLLLTHQVEGISHIKKDKIIPFSFSYDINGNHSKYKGQFDSNLEKFSFIKVNKQSKRINFNKGNYSIDTNIIIPRGFLVTIPKGFSLDMINNASVVSFSTVQAKGNEKTPIKFYSSDESGGGVFITEAKDKSIFNHCIFSGLSFPAINSWSLSGAVNFHETEVELSNCTFENNRCEDALNVIRSNFVLKESIFKNTLSDAFDGDFVTGNITGCEFIDSGNDAIDVSGSNITINDIVIKDSSDKAISGGEGSKINGSRIKIINGELGIVSKDLSYIKLSDIEIENTRLAFSCFQKKPEYGAGHIEVSNCTLSGIELDYLIEYGSALSLNGNYVETVSNKVIDQLYGREYGKSTAEL